MNERALTKNQLLVFKALLQAGSPLSAYGILDLLRQQGLRAPLQIYRALEKLLEFGMVHRLESLNAFVACAHSHDGCDCHGVAGFAICNACGQVTEFNDRLIDDRLRHFVAGQAFKPVKTTIEIRGFCKSCAPAEVLPSG